MPLLDFLFGNEDVRKAMQDQSYLDPSASSNPDAAREAASRMDLSNRLGKAALAVAQANQKGAGPGTILAAFGGGFGAGGSDLQDQQLRAAQIRGVLAQAKQRETLGALGGVLKGPSGRVGKGPDGMIYEVWRDGSTHILPMEKMKGYAGQSVPPLDQVIGEVRQQTLGALNPNQSALAGTPSTVSPSGGKPASPSVARPRSQDEYDALPSGTPYYGPDGRLLRKP